MQNQGQVIIYIDGKYGADPLTPDNYDITLMRDVMEYASAMLDLDKKKDRPVATFHIENGSVKKPPAPKYSPLPVLRIPRQQIG